MLCFVAGKMLDAAFICRMLLHFKTGKFARLVADGRVGMSLGCGLCVGDGVPIILDWGGGPLSRQSTALCLSGCLVSHWDLVPAFCFAFGRSYPVNHPKYFHHFCLIHVFWHAIGFRRATMSPATARSVLTALRELRKEPFLWA